MIGQLEFNFLFCIGKDIVYGFHTTTIPKSSITLPAIESEDFLYGIIYQSRPMTILPTFCTSNLKNIFLGCHENFQTNIKHIKLTNYNSHNFEINQQCEIYSKLLSNRILQTRFCHNLMLGEGRPMLLFTSIQPVNGLNLGLTGKSLMNISQIFSRFTLFLLIKHFVKDLLIIFSLILVIKIIHFHTYSAYYQVL